MATEIRSDIHRPSEPIEDEWVQFHRVRLNAFLKTLEDNVNAKWQNPERIVLAKKAVFSAYIDLRDKGLGHQAQEIVELYVPSQITSHLD